MRHPSKPLQPTVGSALSRRSLLRVGGLGLTGLTLPGLLRAEAAPAARGSFGRARSCIVLYMMGGPPQHETWDPKPEAPAEVRGAYGAISTPVDGFQVGELMPRLARLAPQYSVIRSLATDINTHSTSGYWVLTGRPHRLGSGEQVPPEAADFPYLGAVVSRLRPAPGEIPTSVTIPEPQKANPGILVTGQYAGFLGSPAEPLLLECEPHEAQFHGPAAIQPALTGDRLGRRRGLLDAVNARAETALRKTDLSSQDTAYQQAFDLLTGARTRQAFDLRQEPASVRERYGIHKFGQSCLLARRLVEAGVRLVTVNWPREPGDLMKGNPGWDTHSENNARLKDALMPPMDVAVSALLEDLSARGMLEETLVVWVGEFGRTPHFNAAGGRDHWGHVFPAMLAGGGIRGGVVFGASDRLGAHPDRDRVEPAALHSTIYHCLGVPPDTMLVDPQQRPIPLCEAEPIRPLLRGSTG